MENKGVNRLGNRTHSQPNPPHGLSWVNHQGANFKITDELGWVWVSVLCSIGRVRVEESPSFGHMLFDDVPSS